MDMSMLLGLEKPLTQTMSGRAHCMEGSQPTQAMHNTVPTEKHDVIKARRAAVLAFVQDQGVTTAQVVSDHFKVSRDTSWRDLLALEADGHLAMRELQRMKIYYAPVRTATDIYPCYDCGRQPGDLCRRGECPHQDDAYFRCGAPEAA